MVKASFGDGKLRQLADGDSEIEVQQLWKTSNGNGVLLLAFRRPGCRALPPLNVCLNAPRVSFKLTLWIPDCTRLCINVDVVLSVGQQ